jgi:RNA polymerase sigma-70 factor (ECF subfamily)
MTAALFDVDAASSGTERPLPSGIAPSRAVEAQAAGAESLAWVAYREHFDSVWRALRRFGVADSRLDDAVQDVFMVVHRRADEFEGGSSLRTWVLGIALRVAANARRSGQRERARFVDTGFSPGESEPPCAKHTPDELAARSEAVSTLHDLLDRMPADQREVLVLVDLEQLSVSEASSALCITPNAAYKRLSLARKRFNQEVERHAAAAKWSPR